MKSKPRQTRRIYVGALVLLALAMSSPLMAQEAMRDEAELVAAMDTLVMEENQALRALESRSRDFEFQAERAENAWPQPVVEYMLDVSAPWVPHFQTTHGIQVMQMIPRAGSREAQGAPARAEARARRVEQQGQAQDLFRDLRLDLLELARQEAREALFEEERAILEDALDVVAALIPVGRGSQGDLLQLELARENLLDQIEVIGNEREERIQALAARAGVDSARIRERIEGLSLTGLLKEEIGGELSSEELWRWAREEEPGLERFAASREVVERRLRLVDERVRPAPEVMVGYMNAPPRWEMDGPRMQMFQVGVRIALPVFRDQYDLEAASWQEAAAAVEEDRIQYLRDLEGRIEALVSRRDSARRRLQRYQRELIPLADDFARQILVGLELGERTATEFLLATNQEIALSRQVVELKYRRAQAEIELQRWTGGRMGAESVWAYRISTGVER